MKLSRAAQFCSTLGLLLSLSFPVNANSTRIFELSADTWARPRSGAALPQMEPVRLAVDYWSGLDSAVLKLSYPGEDSGELWAAELRDWLISLGIPSHAILLAPGLQTTAEIRILVGLPGEVGL